MEIYIFEMTQYIRDGSNIEVWKICPIAKALNRDLEEGGARVAPPLAPFSIHIESMTKRNSPSWCLFAGEGEINAFCGLRKGGVRLRSSYGLNVRNVTTNPDQ